MNSSVTESDFASQLAFIISQSSSLEHDKLDIGSFLLAELQLDPEIYDPENLFEQETISTLGL